MQVFFLIVKFNLFFNIYIFKWLFFFNINLNYMAQFNSIIFFMYNLICIVSLIIIFYSFQYLEYDPFLVKFIILLLLFVFFMFLFISSNNFFQLFFGWELIGIISYLLISFWFFRLESIKSSLKSIIVNKIGDLCLIMGIGLIFFNTYSLTFESCYIIIFLYINDFFFYFNNIIILDFICFLFWIAAISKSAQIFQHVSFFRIHSK